MAIESLIQTFRSLFAFPAIWLSGIIAALGILGTYITYTIFGLWLAVMVALLTVLIVPFFFAGTYGILLDNNKKKGAFIIYGAYGYFKTLLPWLFLLLITIVGTLALNYFLIIIGISDSFRMIISCLIIFPIIFYCYFADISAIRHNLRTWQAIKDSAHKVSTASFSVIAFYLFNILIIIFILPLLFDLLFGLFGGTEIVTAGLTDILSQFGITDLESSTALSYQSLLENISSMTEEDYLLIINEKIIPLFTNEVVLRAFFLSAALISLVFLPFLVSFKTYYYQKMLLIQQKIQQQKISTQPGPDADGEFDEKGRWFKYK